MSSTYTPSNRFDLQATGDNPSTWGDRLNQRVFSMIDEALDGINTLDITITTAYTLTTASGTTDQARKRVLNITGTATADATITVPALNKFYAVKCSFTGGYTVTIKTASDAGVVFTAGDAGIVFVTSSGVFEVLRKSDMLLAENNLSELTDPAIARESLGMGNPTVNTFINDGSTTVRTLTQNPGTVNSILVVFDGVVQTPNVDYTLSGTTLTYATAPSNGTKELIFIGNQSLPAGEPSDGSVTAAKIVDGVITYAKMISSAFASVADIIAGTASKIVDAATAKITLLVQMVDDGSVGTGTTKDITIPTGVKRVTLHLAGVSLNATDNMLVRLGDSGGISSTGYTGSITGLGASTLATVAQGTTGISFANTSQGATTLYSGSIIFEKTLESTHSWSIKGHLSSGGSAQYLFHGNKTLTNELSTIRLTSFSGTSTFDAGTLSHTFEY